MTTDIGENKKFSSPQQHGHGGSNSSSSSLSRKLFCLVVLIIGITAICQFDLTFLYSSLGGTAETTIISAGSGGTYFSSGGTVPYDDSEEHKILQISVLGERNSGTRWTSK